MRIALSSQTRFGLCDTNWQLCAESNFSHLFRRGPLGPAMFPLRPRPMAAAFEGLERYLNADLIPLERMSDLS
jgi:hypothetical protein